MEFPHSVRAADAHGCSRRVQCLVHCVFENLPGERKSFTLMHQGDTDTGQFNDIATSPGGSPVVTQNPPPTPYDGLAYENFTVVAQAPVPAVLDHSPPNHGSATTINALAHAGQALRANYAGSHVAAFDLHDFWFGCKLLTVQQPNGGPAQACTVQVTGYKQDPLHPSVCDTAGVSKRPRFSQGT